MEAVALRLAEVPMEARPRDSMSAITEGRGSGRTDSAFDPNETSIRQRRGYRLAALLVLLVVAGGVATASRWTELREWWLERQSAESLRTSAQSEGADASLLFIYARKLVRDGKPEEAVDALTKAEQKLPPDSKGKTPQRILAYLGYLLARQGDGSRATPYLTRAREMNELDALPYLGFGIIFAERQMPKFALTQFEVATQLDPENVEAWYRLGKAAIENLKAQQGIEPLKKAIALAPNDAESHAQLGIAYAVQSQFAKAVPEFRRSVELAPDQEEYRALLANALAMNARNDAEYREAAILLEEARKSRPGDDNLLLTAGLLHLRFNDVSKAKERLEESVRIAPKNASAWYNLSVVEQRQGNTSGYEAARKRFQKLTDIHTNTVNLEKSVASKPRDAELRLQLSKAYKHAGNLTGAYWQLTIAKRLAPENRVVARSLEALSRDMPPSAMSRSNAAAMPGESPGPPPPSELVPELSAEAVASPGRNPR